MGCIPKASFEFGCVSLPHWKIQGINIKRLISIQSCDTVCFSITFLSFFVFMKCVGEIWKNTQTYFECWINKGVHEYPYVDCFPMVAECPPWMGKVQHPWWIWRCPNTFAKTNCKIYFWLFSKLQGKKLKKLAKGLFSKTITFREHPMKGRWPNLKSMYKFTRMFKHTTMIWNEIMIHFGHPKPTTNNQKPYSDDEWQTLKDEHKLDKMFSILDSKLNDDFYLKKLRSTP